MFADRPSFVAALRLKAAAVVRVSVAVSGLSLISVVLLVIPT